MEMTKEQALNEFKRQVRLNQSIGYDEMLSILKEHFQVEANNSEAMKNEAILFAEWLNRNEFRWCDDGQKTWWEDNEENESYTEELYDIYLTNKEK